MSEEEWLAATDLYSMWEFLWDKASDRKSRLFTCASCRRFWHLLNDARSRYAVEIAERFADDKATKEEMLQASQVARFAAEDLHQTLLRMPDDIEWEIAWKASTTASAASAAALSAANDPRAYPHPSERSRIRQPSELYDTRHIRTSYSELFGEMGVLCRDIFGNPFRPVTFDPSWLTSAVLALASGIFNDRAFDRMPILADALQDADCENEDILNHCRGDEPHVKGCWVVDLLLGKK
jgi:hypothetical protein